MPTKQKFNTSAICILFLCFILTSFLCIPTSASLHRPPRWSRLVKNMGATQNKGERCQLLMKSYAFLNYLRARAPAAPKVYPCGPYPPPLTSLPSHLVSYSWSQLFWLCRKDKIRQRIHYKLLSFTKGVRVFLDSGSALKHIFDRSANTITTIDQLAELRCLTSSSRQTHVKRRVLNLDRGEDCIRANISAIDDHRSLAVPRRCWSAFLFACCGRSANPPVRPVAGRPNKAVTSVASNFRRA